MLRDYNCWVFLRGEKDAILNDVTFKNLWDDPEYTEMIREVTEERIEMLATAGTMDGWNEIAF